MKMVFPTDTAHHFVKEFFKTNYEHEIAQTLCLVDKNSLQTIVPGGEIAKGSYSGVKPPPMKCEKGKAIGSMHTHNEPYFDGPPFDKGSSDVDFFTIVQKGLCKEIDFPYVGCVLTPVAGDDGDLTAINIACEQFDKFTEDDIKNSTTGMIRNTTKGKVREKFSDENVEFFKKGNPPKGGMFQSMGFKMGMHHLKRHFMEEGIMEQDDFKMNVKWHKDGTKVNISYKDEVLFG